MPLDFNPLRTVDNSLQLLQSCSTSATPIRITFEAAAYGSPLKAKEAARAFARRCAATRIRERDKARKSEWADDTIPGPYACVHIATVHLDNGNVGLVFTRSEAVLFTVEAEDGTQQTWDEFLDQEAVKFEVVEAPTPADYDGKPVPPLSVNPFDTDD